MEDHFTSNNLWCGWQDIQSLIIFSTATAQHPNPVMLHKWKKFNKYFAKNNQGTTTRAEPKVSDSPFKLQTYNKDLLVTFYRCSIESILVYCISTWYTSCTAAERKVVLRVINCTQGVTGAQLPPFHSYLKLLLSL